MGIDMDTKPPVSPAPSLLGIQPVAAILTFVLIVAVLYLGRGIFVPLVLAVLLAFALAPLSKLDSTPLLLFAMPPFVCHALPAPLAAPSGAREKGLAAA